MNSQARLCRGLWRFFVFPAEVIARQDRQKRRLRRAKNARDLIFYAAGARLAIRLGGANSGLLRGNYVRI